MSLCKSIYNEATYRCMCVKGTSFQHQIVCCGSMQKHIQALRQDEYAHAHKERHAKVRNEFRLIPHASQMYRYQTRSNSNPKAIITDQMSIVNMIAIIFE